MSFRVWGLGAVCVISAVSFLAFGVFSVFSFLFSFAFIPDMKGLELSHNASHRRRVAPSK